MFTCQHQQSTKVRHSCCSQLKTSLSLSLSSLRVLVGPLGRAWASRPFVPPPTAETANQAAAVRPVHRETPVGLALTRFTPLTLNPAPCRSRETERHNLCSRDSPLCWRRGELQHEDFYKATEEGLCYISQRYQNIYQSASGRTPHGVRPHGLIWFLMSCCRPCCRDTLASVWLDSSLRLATEATQYAMSVYSRMLADFISQQPCKLTNILHTVDRLLKVCRFSSEWWFYKLDISPGRDLMYCN